MPSRERVRKTLSAHSVSQRQAAGFVFASSQQLGIADNAALSMGAGVHPTVAAWAWLTDKAQFSMFACKGSTTAATQEYMLIYNSTTDTFQWRIGNGTVTSAMNSTAVVSSPKTGTWYHLAGQYDGATSGFYINGQLSISGAYSSDILDGANPFRIGADSGLGPLFASGRAASVGVWKRVLTPAEIVQLFAMGPAGSFRSLPAGLLTSLSGWWDLDGDALDKSGGGNNLTNTNAVGFLPAVY